MREGDSISSSDVRVVFTVPLPSLRDTLPRARRGATDMVRERRDPLFRCALSKKRESRTRFD